MNCKCGGYWLSAGSPWETTQWSVHTADRCGRFVQLHLDYDGAMTLGRAPSLSVVWPGDEAARPSQVIRGDDRAWFSPAGPR